MIAIVFHPYKHRRQIRNQDGNYYCLQINESPFGLPRILLVSYRNNRNLLCPDSGRDFDPSGPCACWLTSRRWGSVSSFNLARSSDIDSIRSESTLTCPHQISPGFSGRFRGTRQPPQGPYFTQKKALVCTGFAVHADFLHSFPRKARQWCSGDPLPAAQR